MHQCPYCGDTYRSGMLFCEECGQQLTQGGKDETLIPRRKQTTRLMPKESFMGRVLTRDEYDTVRLYVQNAELPIIFEPCVHTRIGRVDQSSDDRPDIDLTVYGAREKGVSRLHAAIECHDDAPVVVDLDSTNGVTVNGEVLPRGASHVLHEGDEVQFGRLVLHIYFE